MKVSRRRAVFAVYAAALLQGLGLVSFPASAGVLLVAHGLDDAHYGALFLPQVACAVLGALAGGQWARRIGLERLLGLALLANFFSQMALASVSVVPVSAVYPALLIGTACLGLGFGLIGAPLNSLPPRYFAERGESALVIAHTLVGAGLMLGPLLMAGLVAAFGWTSFPLFLALAFASLAPLALGRFDDQHASATVASNGSAELPVDAPADDHGKPLRLPAFWLFVAIAVLYAFAEGSFSNWAVVFLTQDKGLSASAAAAALSVFWGALVGGRLLVSALILRIPAQTIWSLLPLLMIAAFLLLPFADGQARALAAFALAGLGCSAFFPLTIALASARFPQQVAWVSSMLIAALMLGVGLGSFAIGALREAVSFDSLYRASSLYPAMALLLILVLGWRERKAMLPEAA